MRNIRTFEETIPLPHSRLAALRGLVRGPQRRSRVLTSRGGVRAVGSAVVTFALFFGVTVWMWHTSSQEVYKVARQSFQYQVNRGRLAIERRMAAYEQVLRGGVGLFAASGAVRRDSWHAYVKALNIDARYPGIQGIGFAERIASNELAAHIQTIRSQGFPQYAVHPPGARAEYTAIIYLEPFDWRNQRAFGYDMFSDPVRHEAMARARDTGHAATSGKVTLVQETKQGVQSGFLMYLPVFKNGAPLTNVDERRVALLGYVYAPFRMNDLMRGILGQQDMQYVRLRVFDGSTVSAADQMYDSQDEDETKPTQQAAAHRPDFNGTESFNVAGRTWTLRFTSLPAFDAAIDVQKPRLILIGGTLISILIAAVVWSLLLSRQQARALTCANRHLHDEIDERAKLEAALKKAKDAAEAANQAKSEFLANVSHELRTPLTLILAPMDELLAGGPPPLDWRTQLERVERNALLLLNRVNDLLDFSKAEAGKFEVCWEPLDLSELVTPLALDAADAARRKGCSLTWQVDPGLDEVCLDRRHVETILLNLASNALKFTPAGGSIHIEAAVVDDVTCQLSVKDSGIGIAKDKVPLLFQRFQQVDTSATRQFGGTGIGLALVRELVQLMGGSIEVESELGRGTCFMVQLPRTVKQGASDGGSMTRSASLTDALPLGALRRARFAEADGSAFAGAQPANFGENSAQDERRMRVLVVDDSADMRAYFATLLGAEWQVQCAADGQQAWDLLQDERIDVVVSDVMMPVIDGLELTRRIKQSELLRHIPVILVTARGESGASASGLRIGADDYLAKPFSPDELRSRVYAAVRMGEVQKELREKSRAAGMAMLATSILHNLGNALNGLTVSSALIQDTLKRSKAGKLRRLADLLQEHEGALPEFFARDPRAVAVPGFLDELAQHIDREHEILCAEARVLRVGAEHASHVVASQQQFAKSQAPVRELVSVTEMMETALTLGGAAFNMRAVAVERDYQYAGSVATDRHKVLQVLINLISNAAQAMQERNLAEPRLRLGIDLERGCVRMAVGDNGVGIDAQLLPAVFNQGTTTKRNGHGYGLHSSANWARELGGSLTCRSEGVGRGAIFVFELPLSGPVAGDASARSTPARAGCGQVVAEEKA